MCLCRKACLETETACPVFCWSLICWYAILSCWMDCRFLRNIYLEWKSSGWGSILQLSGLYMQVHVWYILQVPGNIDWCTLEWQHFVPHKTFSRYKMVQGQCNPSQCDPCQCNPWPMQSMPMQSMTNTIRGQCNPCQCAHGRTSHYCRNTEALSQPSGGYLWKICAWHGKIGKIT